MTQLRRQQTQFSAAGARIVLVGLGDPEQSESFKKQFNLDFPLISDPDRVLYKAFGLYRTHMIKMAAPSLFLKGIKTMMAGNTLGIPKGDIKQLSGVFIIDRNGMIRFSHRVENPADHPSPDEILSAVAQLS